MRFGLLIFALVACLQAPLLSAQSAPKPLNLRLPAHAAGSANAPEAANARPVVSPSTRPTLAPLPARRAQTNRDAPPPLSTNVATQPVTGGSPGVYYGDHSNTTAASIAAENDPARCDDATYNDPQVHGSVGTGIVTGSHIRTGSYSGGVATLSRAFGSCDHPEGGVSISVGGTTDHGFGPRYGR